MIPSDKEVITFQGDPEHAGIRLAVLPLLAVGYVAGFGLVRLLLGMALPGNEFLLLFACLGGFPIGLAVAAVGERLLSRTWRSGRQLTLGPSTIRLIGRRDEFVQLALGPDLAARYWTFPLTGYPRGGRERRAPRGWLCLASQVRRDEGRITLFTFMPPAEAQALLTKYAFQALDPAEVYDTSLTGRFTQPTVRPSLPSDVIAGRLGPFWLAERHRWEAGLELRPADFVKALAILEAEMRGGASRPSGPV